MKGRKEIEELIQNNQYKDIIAQNENILKSYIMEKSVLPKLKRDSKVQKLSRSSIFRLDTVSALNNLIHQKTFLDDIKRQIKGKGHSKRDPFSASPVGKKVTFGTDSAREYDHTRPFSSENKNDLFNSIKSYDDNPSKNP
jgi:hypothetical protein